MSTKSIITPLWFSRIFQGLVQFSSYLKGHWKLLALVILYIFFRPTFEKKIGALLVDFNGNQDALYCCLILAAIAIIHAIALAVKGYTLSNGSWLWFLIVLIGWRHYRLEKVEGYELLETPIKGIYYIDFLLVVCVYIAIVKILRRRRKVGSSDRAEGYVVDCPISIEDEDQLGRREKVERLASMILKTDTSRGAFTLGLVAPWGAGKTSFMQAVEKSLEKCGEEIILIKFNPWMYRKAPNLTQIFFEELSRALAPYNSALGAGFIRYVDYILAKDNNVWVQLGAHLLSQESNTKSTGEQYDFLKREISKLGRRIFIFIDDVDRLDGDELIELFCLVRNSSSFPYMSYILAYDKEYVASQLRGKLHEYRYRYMEKILQEEYPLAEITPAQIKTALEEVLGEVEPVYPDLKTTIITSGIELKQHFPTLRSIKRIHNALLSIPEELKGNVLPFDWFIIELIRIQYPLLFDFLKGNYVRAFDNSVDGRLVINTEMKEEGEGTSAKSIMSDHPTEGEPINFSSYLSVNKELVPPEKVGLALELMIQLWGEKREYAHRRVNNWEYVGIYFYRTMSEDDINTAELRQYLALPVSSSQDSKNKIKGYVDLMLNSSRWLTFCDAVCEEKVDSLDKTINMLYLAFYMLSKEERRLLTNEISQIDKCLKSIRESEEEEGQKKILTEIFAYPDIRRGVILYISSVLNRQDPIAIPFTQGELENIKENLFLQYAKEEKPDKSSVDPVSCYRLWLLSQTYVRVEPNGSRIQQIDPEKSSHGMNERMKEIIEENIEKLIPYLVLSPLLGTSPPKPYKPYLPYPIWTLDPEEISAEISGFTQFISGLNATSSPVIEEFQRFLNEWQDCTTMLGVYLDNPQGRDQYEFLSLYDRAWADEWLMNHPEYHQGLQQGNKPFFQMLRYRGRGELGFVYFDFKDIQPKDIWSVSTSRGDSPIEL